MITDGVDYFLSNEDIRHYSKPPYINQPEEKGTNRIYKIELSKLSASEYCESIDASLRRPITKSQKAKNIIPKSLIAGSTLGILGGPILGLIGAGLVGWVSSDSEFEESKLKRVFDRAKENHEEWEKYFVLHADYVKQELNRHLTKAKKNWAEFYKLRNFESVGILTGLEFENVIGDIYKSMGFSVTFTPKTGDYGVDLIVKTGEKTLAIQVKRYAKPVGVAAIQEVSSGAKYYKIDQAVVVTNAEFTENAKKLASKLNVELIGKTRLIPMWMNAFPEVTTPTFELEIYERMEPEIMKLLYRK